MQDVALFDGETYDAGLDKKRLSLQIDAVRSIMTRCVGEYEWWTLEELSVNTGFPQASISARIRDLRKERFGGYEVQRRRRGNGKRGFFEYRINPNQRAAKGAESPPLKDKGNIKTTRQAVGSVLCSRCKNSIEAEAPF